jgi:hypothetical protein
VKLLCTIKHEGEVAMGSARTELTRLALLPLVDVEEALFVPVDESDLREFVDSADGQRVSDGQPSEVLAEVRV